MGCVPRSTVKAKSALGPVDSSFRALSGRLKFTVRRHKFNTNSLSIGQDEMIAREGKYQDEHQERLLASSDVNQRILGSSSSSLLLSSLELSDTKVYEPQIRASVSTPTGFLPTRFATRFDHIILVFVLYLVIYDSGLVAPRHLLVLCDLPSNSKAFG